MTDASKNGPTVNKKEDATGTNSKDADVLTVEDVREQIRYIEKAVATKEVNFMTRAVRSITWLRKRLNSAVITKLTAIYCQPNGQADAPSTVAKDCTLAFAFGGADGPGASLLSGGKPLLPETETFLHLLYLLHLLDAGRLDEAVKCGQVLVARLASYNRRTLDQLAARAFFYHARTHELTEQLAALRPFLLAQLRTCSLRQDTHGCAVLLNLLLRNYLHYGLAEQADKLVARSAFPEAATNPEWARHLFYLGRIKALQLEYSAAAAHLASALRKAGAGAAGFRQAASKLSVVVALLLGETPERQLFRQPVLRLALAPYLALTQAVRGGDMAGFAHTLEAHRARFLADKTWHLIVRLRHNVIKAGVVRIAASYSAISLAGVAAKLQLDSAEEAEYVAAKAVRDGIIEAAVDHGAACLRSRDTADLYSTGEPAEHFHQRIKFCLSVREQTLRAMRYPQRAGDGDAAETAEERRARETAELETATELSEDEFDDY